MEYLAALGGADGDRRARLVAGMAALEAHEDRLRQRVEDAVAELPGVTLWSRARHRTPTLLLTWADRPAAEVSRALAERGVNAPAGSFYAIEASRRLGLGDTGGLRVGLAPYTDDSDVDRLLDGLREASA
ncbi:aminotransferase class V-fold PLP-dependent enzyme [Geodermatophilus maliterrae]|uniref:Aminotransferase class V-fold PLP-dependent enzyme n=1 Tax=Geodermatophilus maliterrae TaxID=3162531 RepID=A0ABV3XLF8_9ACTN